jgi:glycosidase
MRISRTPLQPVFEFHISREMRDFYKLEDSLFAQNGNVIFTNFFSVRSLAAKINQKHDLMIQPEKTIRAGQLNAMGLIDEILHYVVSLFKEQKNKDVFDQALAHLSKEIGSDQLKILLEKFVDDFPPLAVYRNKRTAQEYLSGSTAKIKNSEIAIEELIVFYLANINPAFSPFRELFDDTRLSKETAYRKAMRALKDFFETQDRFGPDNQYLLDMLRTPALKYPHSLSDQLEFIRRHWGVLLSKYLLRLLSSLDLIKEENKPIFAGPGPTYIPDFVGEDEYERFSQDLDWMPKVVMIAKSTYVWLDQLSKKYQRDISKLNQIPDEELDLLADRGFTALWLIGLWERSNASKKIKQINGNPEAVSSAYSLYEYSISHDLGGDGALKDLQQRAWNRGIRVASDMVPNHMGLFSKWVVEHPNWFIQCDHPIYPNYSFNGPNLSDDDRVGIYIEDGYWNRSDAAVLFKRVDHHTGDTKYIYHGNDGTSMPWNDTAQLNFLLAEVREAVIQTILHVARQFPIIRLDAAMTLAKKHFQRLWFPAPGSGGDIPSRSEFAISAADFNQMFPVEFWREVVDRVAKEVPDTLLLAEAFWMMEGYFVRTLGMHRVYNSAFMNMLKNEENQKYRQAIKEVMDFNPEIMKRYVNFMNNPDEETAVAQFGKDDKYFGVCIMMSTLPGLPMFGHGQVEGFTEKYGMEYRRAYWDEQEDMSLVERHYREIFPLLKKRYLFSNVENFVLYDVVDHHGLVNENVFAYSNRAGNERALVVYNNKYDQASGWVRYSSACAQKGYTHSLRSGMALNYESGWYTIFRDLISGLEFIRSNQQFQDEGLFVLLDGFKYHVFTDFREIKDDEYHHYAQITAFLDGRGVPSVEETLKETFLAPVHQPFNNLVSENIILLLSAAKISASDKQKFRSNYTQNMDRLLSELQRYFNLDSDISGVAKHKSKMLTALFKLLLPDELFKDLKRTEQKKLITLIGSQKNMLAVYYLWIVLHDLGTLQDKEFATMLSLAWFDELLFAKITKNALVAAGYPEGDMDFSIRLLRATIAQSEWIDYYFKDPTVALHTLFETPESNNFLQVNRYHDTLYFNKEAFEQLINALVITTLLSRGFGKKVVTAVSSLLKLKSSAEKAGYRIEDFILTVAG